jgi:hypothetical protein
MTHDGRAREPIMGGAGGSTRGGRIVVHGPAQPPAPAGGGGSGLAGGCARTPPAAAGAAAAGSQGGGDARPCAEGAVDPRSAAAAAWREGDRSVRFGGFVVRMKVLCAAHRLGR